MQREHKTAGWAAIAWAAGISIMVLAPTVSVQAADGHPKKPRPPLIRLLSHDSGLPVPMAMRSGDPDVGDPTPWPKGTGGACNLPSDIFQAFPSFEPRVATGTFVNFESPPVVPLAVADEGKLLLATNTPNNSLVIFETEPQLAELREVPVGLEPVAVAEQPATGLAWVVNHLSDNVSIVNPRSGKVLDVVEVGDEPVNVLFDPTGAWAFVVIQGIAHDADLSDPLDVHEGNVVVVDTVTRQVVSSTYLDANTPRGAVYDANAQRLVVAALYSGNNTTTAGEPVALHTLLPPPPDPPPGSCDEQCQCTCSFRPMLEILRDFSVTAAAFQEHLGVWPDVHDDPALTASAPLVHRVVEDEALGGAWQAVLDHLFDDGGAPLPGVVEALESEFGISNGAEVLDHVAAEVEAAVDHDLIVLDASDPGNPAGLPVLGHTGGVGTTLTGMARHPVDGRLFVANMEALNTVRLVQNLKGHFVDHELVVVGDPLDPGSIEPWDLHAGIAAFQTVEGTDLVEAQEKSLANPLQPVVHRNGATVFLPALGPGRVGSLDAATGTVLDRVDVGRGTRGLALRYDPDRLYAFNRTDLTITEIDVSDPAAMAVVDTVGLFNPEPDFIRDGRDFLYSTRFSLNFASSCAICHTDANLDHLAWDLGDHVGGLQPAPPNLPNLNNHPLKGPMVTMSLRGLENHEHFHWRGDKPMFQDFNEAFANLLGGSELPDPDMDAFAAFIKTVVYPPSPFWERDDTLKDEPQALCGIVPFVVNCDVCHRISHDGAMPGFLANPQVEPDLGGIFSGPPLFAQLQMVTQLRGIHKKFHSDRKNGVGLIHDGRERREPVILGTEHPIQTFDDNFFPAIQGQEELDMISFMNAFPTNVKPVVGWQVHVHGDDGAAALATVSADVNLMITQHEKTPSHCDVVAKGFVGGVPHGYFYNEDDLFESDTGETLTLAQLLASLEALDELTFTAVPPGSGKRIGIG